MAYGLLSTGFVEKPLSVILEEVATAQRASPALGSDWDTSAESPGGQINAAFGAQLASAWEAIGLVYRSRVPGGASFAGLDALCGITGTEREPARKGTVTLTVLLGAGVTLPAGSIAHVTGQPGNRWVTLASATNSGGSPANVDVDAEAEVAGFYVANAGTITGIATPVTGWSAVTNIADADTGSAAEQDPALRVRRDDELVSGGTSPPDAIRARVRDVTGVSSVVVELNTSDAYDAIRDLAGHSVRCVVQGGTDGAVAAAIWNACAAGIETQGSLSVIITDDGGFPRVVRFSRPSNVNAYATVRVIYDAATYAGDAALKAAIAAITSGQLASAPIRMSSVITAALAVAGVTDPTSVLLGRSAGAQYASNLSAGPFEVLKLDAARITITRVYA